MTLVTVTDDLVTWHCPNNTVLTTLYPALEG